MLAAEDRLESEQERLEGLKHQQHTAEWEIDDINTKIATAEESLFSGRIKNPKELASLQQEVEMFKTRRGQLEEKALGVIDKVEQAEAAVAHDEKRRNRVAAARLPFDRALFESRELPAADPRRREAADRYFQLAKDLGLTGISPPKTMATYRREVYQQLGLPVQ